MKNEKPDADTSAEIASVADLVSEAGSTAPAGFEKPGATETPAEAKAETPAQEPVAQTAEPAAAVVSQVAAATPDTGGTPAQQVTATQLVSEQLPPVNAAPAAPQPKRGRGRPPGSTNKNKDENTAATSPSNVVIPPGGEQTPGAAVEGSAPAEPAKPAVNHRQLAEISFDLITNSAAAMIGPEWRANDAQEREGVLVPLEMYFKTKQMDDIPPGAILCFAIASYSAPRLRAPATSSKIKLGWAWLSAKWNGRKKGFAPRVVKSDNGNPFAEKN